MLTKIALSALTLSLLACGGGDSGANSTSSAENVLTVVGPNSSVTIPTSTYPANSAEQGGWTILQEGRVLCGFGALTQNTKLDAAALAHSRYQTSISVASGTSILTHVESILSDRYYTGQQPWDRTTYQGYGNQVAEILEATQWDYDSSNPPAFPTLKQRGANSMRSLMNTVYHLIGAMYEGADVGFGSDIQTYATSGTMLREEYRFGSLNGYQTRTIPLGTGKLVTYPCQGSSNIPSTFVPANESPNPFPTMTSQSQTVGPPIYLKVDTGKSLKITSSSISQGGLLVPTLLLTNANDPQRPKEIGINEAFVVPSSALSPNTSYQVSLTGTINGTAFSRTFTMTTGL